MGVLDGAILRVFGASASDRAPLVQNPNIALPASAKNIENTEFCS
jgi:hypothetical protein